MRLTILLLLSISGLMLSLDSLAQQQGIIRGKVISEAGAPMPFVNVGIRKLSLGGTTDAEGNFSIRNIPMGEHLMTASFVGYEPISQSVGITPQAPIGVLDFVLKESPESLGEVVVSGTMKEVSKLDSPVPVEVYSSRYFLANPAPSVFESMQNINGVRPQVNCNVCNTGDIHINGLEGPYTMVLIDGMPIVSGLSTVYGLTGIPQSIIERVEVVKGPASTLYGSEAVGGLINIITKKPYAAPLLSADVFATAWGEVNTDLGLRYNLSEKAQGLLGINYFNYQNPLDKNQDGFTDVTLQDRISIFNKWNFQRKNDLIGSLAARYIEEDRWGGEMNWSKKWRGSDQVYGESIYTRRAELIGMYQLPIREKIYAQLSYNWHDQNSWYGDMPYMANQQVAFVQTYWDKDFGQSNAFLLGMAFRYNYYDDNTPATATSDGTGNQPAHTYLPGAFVQNEWTATPKHKLLVGYRYDYDKNHGHVHSPRMAYKWSPHQSHTIRASFGTGFRVVNLFTEDHAALTGAREVIIANALDPERSYNANLNYVVHIPSQYFSLEMDMTGFYSYFTNKIVADFDTDPQKILYDNLRGHAIAKGISLDTDFIFDIPLRISAGISYMDVYTVDEEDGKSAKSHQLHAPRWSGNFVATYTWPKGFSVDLTGQWYGPMRLPILPNDYRPEYSPWFFIANIQITKDFAHGISLYGGAKNIFNFVPRDPIMRSFDPFDRHVNDPVNNPYGYTFDPSYNYASLQGIRAFAGIRYNLARRQDP